MFRRINDAKNELICVSTEHRERDTRVFDVKSSDKHRKRLFTYVNVLTLSSHWETDGRWFFNGTKYLQDSDTRHFTITAHIKRYSYRWQGPPHINKVKQYKLCFPLGSVCFFSLFRQKVSKVSSLHCHLVVATRPAPSVVTIKTSTLILYSVTRLNRRSPCKHTDTATRLFSLSIIWLISITYVD